MIKDDLFSTSVYRKICNIDLETLEKKCLDYADGIKSEHRSNVGGYQGHGFHDEELFLEIHEFIITHLIHIPVQVVIGYQE